MDETAGRPTLQHALALLETQLADHIREFQIDYGFRVKAVEVEQRDSAGYAVEVTVSIR